MPFNFQFRSLADRKDLSNLTNFLIKQNLGYPNYEDWVQRTEHQLDLGNKTPIVAYSNGNIAGNLIYQPHKELPRVREIKNLRIHPQVRRRHFAQFMLKQMELDTPQNYDAIIVDARTSQTDIITMFLTAGYTPIATKALYDNHHQDTIMVKTTDSGIIYNVKNLMN
tara:strand:- start:53432 stop:53932 length:501 start_codon:yes stop_codon:yes gene_type:complete